MAVHAKLKFLNQVNLFCSTPNVYRHTEYLFNPEILKGTEILEHMFQKSFGRLHTLSNKILNEIRTSRNKAIFKVNYNLRGYLNQVL